MNLTYQSDEEQTHIYGDEDGNDNSGRWEHDIRFFLGFSILGGLLDVRLLLLAQLLHLASCLRRVS